MLLRMRSRRDVLLLRGKAVDAMAATADVGSETRKGSVSSDGGSGSLIAMLRRIRFRLETDMLSKADVERARVGRSVARVVRDCEGSSFFFSNDKSETEIARTRLDALRRIVFEGVDGVLPIHDRLRNGVIDLASVAWLASRSSFGLTQDEESLGVFGVVGVSLDKASDSSDVSDKSFGSTSSCSDSESIILDDLLGDDMSDETNNIGTEAIRFKIRCGEARIFEGDSE